MEAPAHTNDLVPRFLGNLTLARSTTERTKIKRWSLRVPLVSLMTGLFCQRNFLFLTFASYHHASSLSFRRLRSRHQEVSGSWKGGVWVQTSQKENLFIAMTSNLRVMASNLSLHAKRMYRNDGQPSLPCISTPVQRVPQRWPERHGVCFASLFSLILLVYSACLEL